MNNLIFTYSLIKALYDKGHDYLDAFWPFIIKILHSDNNREINFIKNKLESNFQIIIPTYIIETIITRAKRNKYITQKEHVYSLTEKGTDYADKLETTTEVQRRINALIEDIRSFLSLKGHTHNNQQISGILTDFISSNREYLVKYINPSSPERKISHNISNDKLIVDYILSIDKSNPEMFSIFQEMVKGSIISAILSARDSTEMMNLGQKSFSKTKLFFDSNIIFSILELHPPEISLPVKELFQLIKDNGFEIYAFDFTVEEICNVIKMYPSCSYKFPTTINVDSIFSYLKKKGWQKTDAQEFIINIENILAENGINVEITNINIRHYKPLNPHLISKMPYYKRDQSLTSQNHDYAAIEQIIKQRNKAIYNLEDSKSIFLTSDVGLYRFNLIEFGHSRNGTVNEVILDKMLTYMLWLKNPKIQLPLSSIISIHSKNLFIERKVWERFYDILNNLKVEKHIDDDDIVSLFYLNFIENKLLELGESDLDQIDINFTIDLIEKARLFGEKAFNDQLKVKEAEFIEELNNKTKEKQLLEQQYENAWYEKVKAIKEKIMKSAKSMANVISLTICVCILVYFLKLYIDCVVYIINLKYQIYLSIFIGSLSFIFGGGIIIKSWNMLRHWLNNSITNIIYKLKVKDIGLLDKKAT